MIKTSRFLRYIVVSFLIVLLVCAFSPSAFADYDGVAVRISALASKFPNGKYWDHAAPYAGYDAFVLKDEAYKDSITDSPCSHYPSYAGSTDCNYFDGGSQCWGFANRLYYEVFGVRCTDGNNTTTHSNKWDIQPGDHVRLSSDHSVFVQSRNGDTLTLIECNYDYCCGILWNRQLNINNISVNWVKHANNWDDVNRSHSTSAELDVNGWLDGAEEAGVTGYATFDVYIDGNLVANDVGDFCTSYGAGASYEIKDIKVASGKAFDGYSGYTRSGYASGLRKGTLNANTDVRLQLHTVDAAAFDRKWVPTDVTVFDGHSYYFYNVPVTWYGGEIVSEYLGGHLVTITSEAENNFVKEFIGACNLWIGATDKDQEGNWKWVSGEPFSYTDWGSGQPDNDSGGDEGAEHYAHIWYNSGAWNDNNGCVKYAFLCEIDSAYSILFNTNGGSGGPGVQWKPVKKSITLSNEIPVKAGYEFMGWQLGDKVYQPGDTYSLDQNRTMTAIWKSLEYTIRYDANGGTNPPENMIVNGGTISISTDIPTRAHHKFIGWGTTATETEVEYAPGDEYKAGQDVTLYAIWERQLENLLILPKSLTTIEEEAFANVNADAVVIPKTVSTIENNAFGDVAIYGYVGTEAETYAIKNNMTFIPLTDDWVLAEDVPDGAKVTDQKWTYLQASSETMESTETSVDGWTQVGFTWEQTGTGTHVYANFPGGFDTGSSFYNAYAKSALSSSETATTKREVSGSTRKDYIYWHWCFTDYVEDSNRNVAVEDAERYGVQTGNVYRDYVFFDAFETTVSLSPEGMTTSGLKSFDGMYSTYHHPEYNLPEYASWWWWRFEVLQQTYTDYQKLFTYIREDAELLESAVEVTPGENISNVQHWVKYSF